MASVAFVSGGGVPPAASAVDPFGQLIIGGGGTVPIPGTYPPVTDPSAGSGNLVQDILKIIGAIGTAIGGIVNPPGVTPLPPGAGVGTTPQGVLFDSGTLITIAVIVVAGVVIAKSN